MENYAYYIEFAGHDFWSGFGVFREGASRGRFRVGVSELLHDCVSVFSLPGLISKREVMFEFLLGCEVSSIGV